jgi:hypothetical protein
LIKKAGTPAFFIFRISLINARRCDVLLVEFAFK